MKFCKNCQTWKDESEFHKNGKYLYSKCKECCKKYKSEYYKENKIEMDFKHNEYREKNKDKEKIRKSEYYEKNKKHILKKQSEYRERNREILNKKSKINYKNNTSYYKNYAKNNKEKRNEIKRKKYKNDFEFKVKILIRTRFNKCIKYYFKNKKIQNINKYKIDMEKIIIHLELTKPKDISNYHIDHIFPVSAFDYRNPVEIAACWAPQNLRWMLAKENMEKHNKYNKEEFKKYLEEFKKNFK